MIKAFTPDPRYLPAWPTLPWPATLTARTVFRYRAMETPEAENLATRIEDVWSCPALSGRERRALLRMAERLWHARPADKGWQAIAEWIGRNLDVIEARHGVPDTQRAPALGVVPAPIDHEPQGADDEVI